MVLGVQGLCGGWVSRVIGAVCGASLLFIEGGPLWSWSCRGLRGLHGDCGASLSCIEGGTLWA